MHNQHPAGKRIAPILLLAAAFWGAAAGAAATEQETRLYVATNGNDAWSGTRLTPNAAGTDGPFATLEGARDAIRTLKGNKDPAIPITVFVRGGRYELSRTFALDNRDSGSPTAPITYRAHEKEQPRLVGGRPITGWQPWKNGIFTAAVGQQGFRGIYFRQLFFNGKRQRLARYPNYDPEHPIAGGWAYVDGKPVSMYATVPGESRRTLRCKPGDVHAWAHPEEMEVMVFPRYNWWNNIIRVAAIDRKKCLVTLAADASYANRPGDRYFFRNALEELDAPGEWYLDQRTWILYFRPPGKIADAVTVAPVLDTLLSLRAVENVEFRGFTLTCCEGTAVRLQDCSRCRVTGNRIRNVGGRCRGNDAAVAVTGGRGNAVTGNDISDVGSNAITLDGGERKTLTPAGHVADNNYIHHPGIFYKQGVGVRLSGVGCRASHNLIHDCPRFGISWGGNDHVIEYNHIRHVCLETADCGAIYCWQVDWTRRGTEIRCNYLHDVIGFGQEKGKWISPHMTWGIYLDDGTCGTHVHDNIVARTVRGSINIHGGRDNILENNILIEGRNAEVGCNGYAAGKHPVPMLRERWRKFSGGPAYDKYPGYVRLKKQGLDSAWRMAGNCFRRNIVYYSNPAAVLFRHRNLPFDAFESDYNLIWHFGLPLRTGIVAIRGVTGPNLVPNPGFEQGTPGEMPAEWHWQVRPNASHAATDDQVCFSGRHSVRVEGDGTMTDASGQILHCNFVSRKIPVQPGKTYRLTARLRAETEGVAFIMMPQCYLPKITFWAKPLRARAGTEWKKYEDIFTFPAPGDAKYDPRMKTIVIRFDILEDKGTIWIDAMDLREAVPMSEWEAWQAKGLDRHSRVADPRFVDAAHDNWRLQSDSPAFALGFQPIPWEKIGPYRSAARASWPIREARGARETRRIEW